MTCSLFVSFGLMDGLSADSAAPDGLEVITLDRSSSTPIAAQSAAVPAPLGSA